jgi:hypothetical protein
MLTAVARQEAPGVWRLLDTRPQVPLSQPALLTNSHNDPSSALSSGRARHRGPSRSAVRLRQVVRRPRPRGELADRAARASRCASSQRRTWVPPDRTALDRLVRDFGAEVRVNYETQSTRLHARRGCFVATAVRHRVRWKLQPEPCRPARRAGVERPSRRQPHTGAASQVRGELRLLLA